MLQYQQQYLLHEVEVELLVVLPSSLEAAAPAPELPRPIVLSEADVDVELDPSPSVPTSVPSVRASSADLVPVGRALTIEHARRTSQAAGRILSGKVWRC